MRISLKNLPDFKDKAFKVSIIIKGADGILEIIGGVLLLFINITQINEIIRVLTQYELSEDPNDIFVNYLITAAHQFSVGSEKFAALYLLSHGIIKILVVSALLLKQLWAYPVALVSFSLFILYQLYQLAYSHSVFILLLTVFDLFILYLTWVEYKRAKARLI